MKTFINFLCKILAFIMLISSVQITEASQSSRIARDDILTIEGGPALTNFFYDKKSLGSSAYYRADGKTYPAFCLQPNRKGAGEHPNKKYDIKTEWTYDDPEVIGMVLNGHPYKTPIEMGVDTVEEAYEVTKAAIWAVEKRNITMHDMSLWTCKSDKLFNAFTKLIELGKQNTQVYGDNSVTATPMREPIVENGKYTKQTFEVKSNFSVLSYEVVLKGTAYPPGTEIRDELGTTAKTSFGKDEKFTIYIPTEGLPVNSVGNVQVDIKAVIESKVIFAGPPVIDDPTTDYQDYLVPKPEQKASTTASTPYKTPDDYETPTPETPSPLRIRKVKAGTTEGLAGAIFEVRDENDSVIWQGHTDGNGEISINVPSTGKYSITKLVAPLHYQLSDNPHQDIVIIADMSEQIVTFENRPTTDVPVYKLDADTNEPLAGATFKLSLDGGHQSWTFITDSSGKVIFKDLPDGTYSIEELIPPKGYLLSDKCKQIIKIVGGVAENQSATFKNHKKPGILILKVDETTGKPLPNAEFQIKKKDGSIVFEGLTDEDGIIMLGDLEADWYTISELSAPEHYLKRDEFKDVKLEPGKQVQVKFDNRRRPALEILKIDEETKMPLSGSKFKVTKTEDKTTSEYITDINGLILIEDLDESIYSVEEIVAPK